ncbi:MAG TPA: DUF5808 domain-containing protein [Actinomycetota bacterium]|nr:DUF5808 domain-containing protein [Actinomycetota bacterium]
MTEQKRRSRSRGIVRLIRLATLAATIAVVAKELQKPRDQRTWTGELGSFVPYDLRVPTLDRVRERVWNADGPIVSPKVFGIGWTVNAGRIARLVQERRGA